ncbi:MAG: hypothetical protein HYY22_02050 [Thaumarchaeota archaeon]|nr:hypothetical protein [Nitrososphaerota archaeon]
MLRVRKVIMIDFDPKYTEIVFLDIESYVPPETRQQSKSSMFYNPARPDNFVLGGVFCRAFPLQKKMEPPRHIWNWRIEDEKTTLLQIYDYFKESWKMIEGKRHDHPDLILVGIGISRFDIPTIYIRSAFHHIDTETALYDTYFKTKIVDLSSVGIPLFKNNQAIFPIYPKTANDLSSRLGIRSKKMTGRSVWDMYELRQFDAIKERTACEVADAVEMTSRISSHHF